MNIGRESETIEHKRSSAELDAGCASIAAILNKHGRGTLFFGVEDDGNIVGQTVGKNTLRNISQHIAQKIDPRISPTIESLTADNGREYIRVSFEGADAPYACSGIYRIRTSDEDRAMTTAQVRQLFIERINREDPWDFRPSGRYVTDVDEPTIKAYIERGVACERIPFAYTDPANTLERLNLLCDDGQLTNAAALCFCPSPKVMLKMGMFEGSNRVNILDVHQVEGTLFDIASRAEYYVLNNIRRRVVIGGGLRRDEVPEIPRAAIREAIINALCHRDYTDAACVQIDIFWNAVEISNPGRFPNGHSPEGYLDGEDSRSIPRNQQLANILFRSKEIESYGTGLSRIKQLCDEAGVPLSIQQDKWGVNVRFGRPDPYAGTPDSAGDGGRQQPESAGIRRNPPESAVNADWQHLPANDKLVCSYLYEHGESSPAELANALGISDRTLRDIFKRLTEGGFIEGRGATKQRSYILK